MADTSFSLTLRARVECRLDRIEKQPADIAELLKHLNPGPSRGRRRTWTTSSPPHS
jgi:hypothetical protein